MLIKIGDAWVDPAEIAMITPDHSADGCSWTPLDLAQHICLTMRQGGSTWIGATMDEAEAALIDAGVIQDPTADEAPELTDAELEELMGLEELGFKYVARDADGKLYAYFEKPTKDGAYWNSRDGQPVKLKEDFDFIDDSEPWSIAWLLCG